MRLKHVITVPLICLASICLALISKNQTWHDTQGWGYALYVSPYVRYESICDHWAGIQRIHFNTLNQLWSLGLTKQHFKGISMSVRVQRAFIWKTCSVPRDVPLNSVAQMCHIVAPFSTLILTLSPSPMEVIRRALFMLDHSTSKSWALRLPCLICDSSAGHWRWLRSAWETQNSLWGLLCNKNQNNDDAKAKLRGVSYMDRAAAWVCNV